MSSRGIIDLEILGTGEFLPATRVTSASLDERFGKPRGWIERHSGVRERPIANDGDTVLTMGAAAARHALERARLTSADLDAIVAVGSVPAQAIPCTAALLQRDLGLGHSGIAAFDVNATCLGFVAALDLVGAAIHVGRYQRVLIVASEKASCGLDWADPRTAALFGDGAAAVVVGRPRTPGPAVLAAHFQTFGEAADNCRIRAGGTLLPPKRDLPAFLDASRFEMKGPQLYRLAAEVVPPFLEQLFDRAGVRASDIDLWVPHQASGKGLSHMQAALDLPDEKLFRTLETLGNQVSASLPTALHRALHAVRIRPGNLVALVGTGAGFSVGGVILRF